MGNILLPEYTKEGQTENVQTPVNETLSSILPYHRGKVTWTNINQILLNITDIYDALCIW